MKYIIYKTTNLIDGKYYIGCHQTNNLDDGYLGSGKYLKRAIKKYGRENFKYEILHEVNTKEEMFDLEKLLVDKALVENTQTYNLKIGGSGGNPGIVGVFKGKRHTEKTKTKMKKSRSKQVFSEETRKKLIENNWSKKDPEAQRKHASKIASGPKTKEHKEKLRQASLKNGSGKSNLGKVREKVKCPHCGKEGANNTMQRWHFKNCSSLNIH